MPLLYNCLIADDSLLDLDVLEMYVTKIDTLQIVGTCSNGLEVITLLNQQKIDIVFSDIDMPEISGIDVLKNLQNPPVFIFISSHTELAAESYSLDVIDFIAKPVTLARLIKATKKAIEYIEIKKTIASKEAMAKGLEEKIKQNDADFFYVKENYDYTRINYHNIIFVESMGDFSSIHTTQKNM